jgi:hypothetical protein
VRNKKGQFLAFGMMWVGFDDYLLKQVFGNYAVGLNMCNAC